MNLIWFLTIGTILSVIFGEFGKYPFGTVLTSIGITDILAGLTLGFFIVWKVGIKKRLFLPKEFQLLMTFWLVGGISLISANNFNGGLYLIRFILYSSMFLVGWHLIRDKQIKIEDLISKIILSGVIISIVGFVQLLIFPNLAPLEIYGYDPHNNRLVSSFLDPNFSGTFLNVCFLLSVYNLLQFKKKIWIINTVIIFLAIFLTFSRSAYLMFLVEILGIGFLKSRKILLGTLLVLSFGFLLIPQFQSRIVGGWQIDRSSQERFASWNNGLVIFQKNPVFGVGFNNLKTSIEKNNLLRSFQSSKVHSVAGVDSSLIFVLATTGVIGLIVYLIWWGYLIMMLGKDRAEKFLSRTLIILILGLVVNSQFVNSLFYPEIMLVYFSILGASMASKEG
jgi:O-antigen ligase